MKKIYLIVLFVSAIGFSYAQEKSDFNVSFDHQALMVKDLETSANFYVNTIGLKEIFNATEKSHIRWFSLGEHNELHLITGDNKDVRLNKTIHLALTVSNFDEFLAHIKASKVEFSDYPGKVGEVSIRADGARQIYIQDPDGYWLEINNAAERTRQKEAQR